VRSDVLDLPAMRLSQSVRQISHAQEDQTRGTYMVILDKTTPTPFLWSPSSLQRFTSCEYSFYLHYLERHQPRPHAAAWFGAEIIHRMIQLAYHGLSLEESFDQVWQTACSPIAADLRAWLDLDREYHRMRGGKRADAKEVVAWLDLHPGYGQLRERIDAYQQSALSYLRWNERIPLANYYRRSAILLEVPPEDVLLPNPWLVEGQWVGVDAISDEHDPVPPPGEEAEDEEKGRIFRLLEGVIGGVPVCGVPDVVALRDDGVMLVGDYKTGKPLSVAALSINMKMIIYCELLRQNGILLDDQEVQIGHI
jgi:hypothetical protein